jgi:hypothetical protein
MRAIEGIQFIEGFHSQPASLLLLQTKRQEKDKCGDRRDNAFIANVGGIC